MSALNAAQKIKNTPHGAGRASRSCSAVIRRFLATKAEGGLDGKKISRLVRMTENIVKIASGKSPQAVAAYTALLDRAYGKVKSFDEDGESLARGGIQVVFVENPAIEGEIVQAKKSLPPKPDFVDVELEEED